VTHPISSSSVVDQSDWYKCATLPSIWLPHVHQFNSYSYLLFASFGRNLNIEQSSSYLSILLQLACPQVPVRAARELSSSTVASVRHSRSQFSILIVTVFCVRIFLYHLNACCPSGILPVVFKFPKFCLTE